MAEIYCPHCEEPIELASLVEAAQYLEVHPESLRRLERYGTIPEDVVVKMERGTYFYKSLLGALKVQLSLSSPTEHEWKIIKDSWERSTPEEITIALGKENK